MIAPSWNVLSPSQVPDRMRKLGVNWLRQRFFSSMASPKVASSAESGGLPIV